MTEIEAIAEFARITEEFFESKELAPYREFYGQLFSESSLTDEQVQHRHRVMGVADALIEAAKQQGLIFFISKAMKLAHELLEGERPAIRGDCQCQPNSN